MNKGICLLGIVILVLAVGILFGTRSTQLYAVVYVYQVDPNSLHIVPPYHYQMIFDVRFPTTERDNAFLDEKIVEVKALYPGQEYIIQNGGWEEETIYAYAPASGIICLIGFVTVAISFSIPSILHKKTKKAIPEPPAPSTREVPPIH